MIIAMRMDMARNHNRQVICKEIFEGCWLGPDWRFAGPGDYWVLKSLHEQDGVWWCGSSHLRNALCIKNGAVLSSAIIPTCLVS